MDVNDAIKMGVRAFEITSVMLASAKRQKEVGILDTLAIELATLADTHARQVADLPDEPKLARHDCKKGCSYCCHLSVALTVPELYSLWLNIPAPLRKGVGELAKDRKRMGEVERCRQKMPCMLLDTLMGMSEYEPARLRQGPSWQANCTIYKHRPLACRAMYAVSADRCQLAFGKAHANIVRPMHPIVRPMHPTLGIQGVGVGAMGAIAEMGCNPHVVAMDHALALLASVPSPELVFQEWLLGHEQILTKARLKSAPAPKALAKVCESMRATCESIK